MRGLFLALLIMFCVPSFAWAQTEGGACASPYNTLGASVITNSSNVYNQWQCDNATLYRSRKTWDISTTRTVVNFGEDGTCDPTYTKGQLVYDTTTSSFLYCDGTSWKEL